MKHVAEAVSRWGSTGVAFWLFLVLFDIGFSIFDFQNGHSFAGIVMVSGAVVALIIVTLELIMNNERWERLQNDKAELAKRPPF